MRRAGRRGSRQKGAVHFEQRPLEIHGGGGVLWRQTWWTVSLLHTLSLGVLNTHPDASFDTGVVHPSRHRAPAGGWELGHGMGQNRQESLSSQSFCSSGQWWTTRKHKHHGALGQKQTRTVPGTE